MIKKLNIARIFNSQRGDTILEVMICVAVLGFMLAAAFSLANRNQISARQSQERGEALQLANSQLELLKTYADARKLPPDPPNKNFCIKDNPASPDRLTIYPTATLSASADDPDNYGACVQGRYNFAVWSPSVSGSIDAEPGVYAVTVRWESAGGAVANEEVKLFYTIYDTENPILSTTLPPIVIFTPPLPLSGGANDLELSKKITSIVMRNVSQAL